MTFGERVAHEWFLKGVSLVDLTEAERQLAVHIDEAVKPLRHRAENAEALADTLPEEALGGEVPQQ